MLVVIFWTVVVLGAVIFLFIVNGVIPLIYLYLVAPFLGTRKDKQSLPKQSLPYNATREETEGENEETIDDENSEEKGEENSCLQDSEDSGEE